jgi:hypothetical protein
MRCAPVNPEKALVIPLHLHPDFQNQQRLAKLKTVLLAESLAFVQMALDNAVGMDCAKPRSVKILERACGLLIEARDRLVDDLL